MSSISEDVRQIREAIYGREVREAIADGIEQCYTDVSGGVTKANTAANAANSAADRAEAAAEAAEEIPGTASLEDIDSLKSIINYDGEFLLQTGNLFDVSAFTPGYLIMSDGSLSANASYGYSDFIRVVPGQKYIASRILSTSGGYYDLNKNFVKRIPISSTTPNCVITPDINGYMRLNIGVSSANRFVVSKGEVLKPAPVYGKTCLRDDTVVDIEQIGETGNLFSKETVSEIGYFIDNNGNVVSLENHCYSDYIQVKKGKVYTCTILLSSPGGFYDTNKNFVSIIPSNENTFTPVSDGYVRINIHKSRVKAFVVSAGNVLKEYPPAGFVAVNNLMIKPSQIYNFANAASRWSEKTIATFGDSRTWYDGKTYGDSTKTEWRGKTCVGYQQQLINLLGCKISQQGASGDTSAQICERIRSFNFSNVDAVLLSGGVNDFVKSSQVTIGEIAPIGSTFDTSTVYGSWQSAIEYILTNYPSVVIYMLIPAIAWTSSGIFPYDIAKIKGEIAELYNIPCLDLYKDGGINVLNRDYWYVDDVSQTNWRLHFNDYGNALIGAKIAKFIDTK